MLRPALCASVILALMSGLLQAQQEHRVVIRKIEGDKITVANFKFNKEEKKLEFTDEKTLTLAKDVKVVTAKFNKETKSVEVGEPLPGGLQNERLQKIGERGVFAVVITNDNNQVTEIRVFPGFKGGKKRKQKD
jgi:uncharacterized protein YaaW (UPF0174 family)